jgi:hypothetical protein
MGFKSFIQNEMKGLFGQISSMNPGTAGHNIEINSLKPNVRKRGTSVQRIMQKNSITSAPLPSVAIPVQRSLGSISNRKFF